MASRDLPRAMDAAARPKRVENVERAPLAELPRPPLFRRKGDAAVGGPR